MTEQQHEKIGTNGNPDIQKSQNHQGDMEQDPGHRTEQEEQGDDDVQDSGDTGEIPGADTHGNTGSDEPTETAEPEDDESIGQTGAGESDTQPELVDDAEDEENEEDTTTLQEEFDVAVAEGMKRASDNTSRPKRDAKPNQDPSFLYNIFESTPQEAFSYLMSADYESTYCFLTEQMTAKKGLKRFKEEKSTII